MAKQSKQIDEEIQERKQKRIERLNRRLTPQQERKIESSVRREHREKQIMTKLKLIFAAALAIIRNRGKTIDNWKCQK